MATYKSPVDLDCAYITDANVHISANSADRPSLDFSLELGRPSLKSAWAIDERRGRIALDYRLSVRASATTSDCGERAFDVSLVVEGRVSADKKAVLNVAANDIQRWLEANAVSLFYAKARAYVEYVSAMSPLGMHSLPTIDPYAFLDGFESDE